MSNFTKLSAKAVVGFQGLEKFMENYDVLKDLNKNETDICGVAINSFVYGYIQGKRDDRKRRSVHVANKDEKNVMVNNTKTPSDSEDKKQTLKQNVCDMVMSVKDPDILEILYYQMKEVTGLK